MKQKKLNKKKVILVISAIFIFVTVLAFLINRKNEPKQISENTNQIDEQVSKQYEEMKNNSTMYNENSTLEELKDEYKITGSEDIYEIETEEDGRKVINVKASVNYKVAFCGMIKNSKPTFGELDSIFQKNSPNRSGIWIKPKDNSKVLSYLNNNKFLKSKYEINEEGYLQITETKNQTEYDKFLQKIVNSDKQYLINISSIYYMIDKVTGEIVDNPYNLLDRYQTYDYCTDEDKTIIFVSENQENYLTDDEIFESIIDLLKIES